LLTSRVLVGTAVVAAAAATLIGSAPAQAATGDGGTCTLNGTAKFTPGVGPNASFQYSFTGALSNCESNASAPASGNIAAGTTFVAPNGATYQLPLAKGAGTVPGNSCAVGTTSGTSVVTWADGKHTVIGYTTNSAAAGVVLSGSVVPSVTGTLVSGPVGSAPTFDVTSDEPALPVGDGAGGILAFEVTDPTQCNAQPGVTTSPIQGQVAVGQTS
jgi:hypothetical protein